MTKNIQPLDIYKKLSRNNCGRCPAGNCMAFAVQVLRKAAPLSDCRELDGPSKKGNRGNALPHRDRK